MTPPEWRQARTLAGLCELTALWIEGKIAWQPGYRGPSDLDDPERLVPLCAALCRYGYMTVASQEAYCGPGYDGALWEQRAAVDGFATAPAAGTLIYAAAQAGLLAVACGPADRPRWLISHRTAVPVTRRVGHVRTGFGSRLSTRFLRDPLVGYGACHPRAVAELCGAWQVTIIDPQWGRQDLLWDTLAAGLTPEVQ